MRLQSREDLIADLQNKTFRDAFVSSRVSNTLALQIRAMRQERGWSQAYLAELLGTSQNAVYRLESPQYGKPSITTLKRLASIFDVGLSVWFSPFSKLVDRVTNLSTDDILVPSFDNDPGVHEREAASIQKLEIVDEGWIRGRLQEQNKRYNLLSFPILIIDRTDTTEQYTTVSIYDLPMESAFFEEIVPKFKHVQVDDATDRRFLPHPSRTIAFDERENKAS